MRLRWRRRRDLTERLRPYLPEGITPEPMVDADPIRMFLHRWMIETGDPIDVVAKGFGLDAELLSAIMTRQTRFLTGEDATQLQVKVGMPERCQCVIGGHGFE